ncbi:LADA_0C00254g1_1 [Lachancea dasiensis]|uniref:LADA_0C00254g1_1 n=1 Tax=Lachancea dasiensis TaxID=1072105 RepID=A0A1G4IXM0_9SACH|nr:LADA_0C00254g1_1 [Lachancea dasiensis]
MVGSDTLDYIHEEPGKVPSPKNKADAQSTSVMEIEVASTGLAQTDVKRGLKPRHISMIAIGGTIATGLFMSISTPLQNAGPAGALIAFVFIGTLAYSVTQSLGEMATFIPAASSVTAFPERFLSPSIGAANGYMYFLAWAITFALELSIVGQVIAYWTTAVPDPAWIAIWWVLLSVFNMFPVKLYGEFEFWMSSIKVVAIVGFLIYALCMVCGAGVMGPVGFRYWSHPGPWGDGIVYSDGYQTPGLSLRRFLGWLSSLVSAAFTFQGTELVGISAGESANPRRSLPRAVNKVIFRISLFFIGSVFFVGLLVPYNDPRYQSDSSDYIAQSPFVIAIENSGTQVLPHIFNAVILTTIISAANSDIYISSRVLYVLAKGNLAPKFFAKTTKSGVPYYSVIATSLVGLLGYMNVSTSAQNVFNWFVNITAIACFIAWLCISLSHIRFMQCLKKKGISRDDLPYKAKFMPFSAYYSVFFVTLIVIIQGFTAFIPSFSYSGFLAAYISVFAAIFIWAVFQFLIFRTTKLIYTIEEIDIDTDRREVDAIVWEDNVPQNKWEQFWDYIA